MEAIARCEERLLAQNLPEETKQILLEYFSVRKAEGLSLKRLQKISYMLGSIFSWIDKPVTSLTDEDLVKILTKINALEKSEWTKTTMKKVLKTFLRWLVKKKKLDIDLDMIKATPPKNKIHPESLLTREELSKILSAIPQDDVMFKTFLATLYESGARISEWLNIKIKNIIPNSIGLRVRIEGKTGSRVILLIETASMLRSWLEIHPRKDDPESFVWVYERGNKLIHLGYTTVSNRLKRACKKAGIRKRIHPHLFRHSRATELASKVSESVLREFFGWAKDSKMPGVYVHLASKNIESELAQVYGIKPAEEGEPIQICRVCRERNPKGAKICWRCGNPLSEEELLKKLTGEEVNPKEFEIFISLIYELLNILKEREPGIFAELVRRKRSDVERFLRR